MALLGIAIFLLVRVRSSVSDSIASLWCTFTLRPGEQECKEKTSANVEDMFGGTVGVVAAGAVEMLVKTELAVMHALNVLRRGGASTEEESALVRDLPDNLKKWKWLKQQLVYAAPVHGTGDNGGIESEGAVPAKPARIKTAANKGGESDVKGSPPSPNGSSGGSASTPTSRGDNLDAHKWDDVDVELEEKPGGVAGMDAEEAEIYERVKARVRDHLEAAKRFISLNINSSDPDMRRLAEGTRDSLEHWFTKGRELKSAYLKTPEDDHMKELQAKYPDNWFEILRARSLDFYETPFSKAGGMYEIIKKENERLGLPVRPPKFYGIDSDSTPALDEDSEKKLRELRYFPESNKDPPSYEAEKVHPDVARLEDSVKEAKRVAVLYKGADSNDVETSDIEAQLPIAPRGLEKQANFEKNFDIAQSAALRLKLLTESLPDDQKGKMMGPKEIDETVIDVLRGVAIDNIRINDRNVAKDKQARDESNARLKEANEIIRSAQDSERKRKQNEKDERDKAESEAKARAERERRQGEQSSPPVQSQPVPGPNETGRAPDVKIPETKTTRIEKRDNTTSDIWQGFTPGERRTIQSIASQQEDDTIQVLLDLNLKPSEPNKSHETRAEAVGMLARGGAPVKEPESETRTQRPANTDTTPPLPPIQRPSIPFTSWPWLRKDRGDATRARNAPRGIDVFYSLQHPAQGDQGVVVQPQTDRTTHDSGYIVSTPPQPTEAPNVTVREPTFKEKFRESVKDLTHDQREAMLKSLLVRMLADAIKRNEETRENNGHATPGREEMSRRDLLKKVLAWKTREKIPEHLQRWLTAATTTTAPKTPAVDTSIADSGVRAAPNTPAADATMNYRGVKQVTQDQRDQAFADVMAKTLGLSDTVKKAQEKAKELEGMLAESEKERKEGEERLGRAQQSLDKKGEELTKVQERIAALEADHSAQTEATRKEITELQSKEIDLKAAIERLEKRHADITKELQKVTAAKEAAERGLREANDRIRELSSELSGARDSLAEEQRRSAETAGRLQEQLAAKDGAIRAQEEVVQRGLDRVRQLEKTAELRGAGGQVASETRREEGAIGEGDNGGK
eukprot:jgi/Mesvir1/22599/Mv05705-RA.1